MSSNELLIRLGVDTSNADKQLKAIKNELKDLGKLINTVDDATEGYNKSANGLSEKLNLQIRTMKTYNTQLEIQQKQLKEYREGLEKSKQKLDELNNAHTKDADAIKKTEALISGYTKQIAKMENDIEQTTASMQAMNREIVATQKSLSGLKWSTWGKQIEKFGKGLKNAGEHISNLGSKLAPLSTAAAGALGYIAKTAMDFESAITQVAVTSQATEEELERLKEAAITLGEELPISSSEAAEGLNYLALAGYTVEEQLTAIEPIAKASVAWNEDLATVSDMATDSLSAMSLSVNDLGRYMDVVSTAQMKSNTTALALMEAYIEVGGTLSQLNVPLEESAALLGVMANRGIKGGEAGRALNAVLVNLTAGTSTSLGALEELNVQTFDAQGNFRGLENILNDLNKALADCTQEEKNNYLAMIGGKQHVSDLNALLAGLSEEYGELKIELTNSTGALNDMTEMMSGTTAMQIEELKGKIESLAINLGEMLLPHISKVVDWLGTLVEKFSELDTETQENILQWMAMTVAITPVLKGLSSVMSVASTATGGLSKLTGMIGKLVGSFGKTKNITDELVTGIGGVTSSIMGSGGLAASFTSLTLAAGPWALGGTVVTLLVAGFKSVTEYMQRAAEVADLVKQGLRGDEISQYYEGAARANESHTERAKDALSRLESEALPHWAAYVAGISEGSEDVITAFDKMYGDEMEIYDQELIDQMNDQLEHAKLLRDTGVISESEYQEKVTQITTQGYQKRKDDIDKAYAEILNIMEKASLIGTEIEDENGWKRTYTQQEWNEEYLAAQREWYNAKNNIIEQGENEGLSLYKRYIGDSGTITKEQYKEIEKASDEWHSKATTENQEYYQQMIDDVEEYGAAYLGVTEMTDDEYIKHLENTRDLAQKVIDGQHKDIIDDAKAACPEIEQVSHDMIDGIMGYGETAMDTTGTIVSEKGSVMVDQYGRYWQQIKNIPEETDLTTSVTTALEQSRIAFENGVEKLPETMQTSLDEVNNTINTTSYVDPVNGLVSTIYGTFETGLTNTDVLVSDTLSNVSSVISDTDLKTPSNLMFDGVRLSAEETFMGLPIITATGMGGLGNTILGVDLATPSSITFGEVTTGAETAFNGLPTIAAVGLGAGAVTLQTFDLLTPALNLFGKIPQAVNEKMPLANTEVQNGLGNMSTTLSSWDISSTMSMPGEAFITSLNTLMGNANIETQTGITNMNTTIQTAPFESTMTEQGDKMINVTRTYYDTLKNVTDLGLNDMNTLIESAPFETTFLTQGDAMVSAQSSNMSNLTMETSLGMYDVLAAMQEVWATIVSWWNSQSLESKEVNVNVRTNYSSSGTPSVYSSGVTPSAFSIYEAQTFNAVGYGLARTLPSMDTYDIPSYTNTGYSEYVTGEKGSSNDIESLLSDQVDLLSQLVKQNNGKSVNVNVDTMELTGAKNADEAQLAMVRFWSKL